MSKSLAEDVMLDKPEKLCEGNPGVKFNPKAQRCCYKLFNNSDLCKTWSSVVAYYDQHHVETTGGHFKK